MQKKKLGRPSKKTIEASKTKTEKPSSGLGDTIQKITEVTGIQKLVHFIAGEDCGCEERKAKLNKLFMYRKPICLTEPEFNYLTEFRQNKANELTKQEADDISSIWNRVFQSRKFYRPCTCNPKAWQEMINDLLTIHNEYQSN